jgi:hypothetical protein
VRLNEIPKNLQNDDRCPYYPALLMRRVRGEVELSHHLTKEIVREWG